MNPVSRWSVFWRIVGLLAVVFISDWAANALGIYNVGGAIAGAGAYIIITERPFA